jgi:hypothetical protein
VCVSAVRASQVERTVHVVRRGKVESSWCKGAGRNQDKASLGHRARQTRDSEFEIRQSLGKWVSQRCTQPQRRLPEGSRWSVLVWQVKHGSSPMGETGGCFR